MRRFLLHPVAVALSLLPVTAFAAPFCLTVGGATPMCIYYDGAQCARDAQRQNGVCGPNPDTITRLSMTSAYGDYCVITPEGTATCGYTEGADCSVQAQRQKGVCTKVPGTGPQQQPNAYNPNANR
jgi:hypothetical protein